MKRFLPVLLLPLLLASAQAGEETRRIQSALKEAGFYYGAVDGTDNADTTAALRRYQIRNGLEVTGTATAETLTALKVAGVTAASSSPLPEQITAPPLDESAPLERPGNPPVTKRAPNVTGVPPAANGPKQPQKEIRVITTGDQGAAALLRFFMGTPWEGSPREEQSVRLAKAQAQLHRLGYYQGNADGLPGPTTEEALLRFQSANRLPLSSRLDADTVGALNAVAAATSGKRPVAPRSGPAEPPVKGVWVH